MQKDTYENEIIATITDTAIGAGPILIPQHGAQFHIGFFSSLADLLGCASL